MNAVASSGSRTAPGLRARPGGVVILGADYRALGVARSLGRRGVPVCIVREPGEPLAATSRFVSRRLSWPDGGGDRAAFLYELSDHGGMAGWALIPSADETAALIARHHDELALRFTLTTPGWDALRWAYDKRCTHELAGKVGVPSPSTVTPGAAELPGDVGVPFPAVVKPAVKETFNALTAAKAWRVDDAEDLRRRWDDACAIVDPATLVVQELIPGGGESQVSFAALCRDGEPVAMLTARRTRQYPADFGRASTFVETVEIPEIVEPSLRLLREIRWTGLIEVEYKRDPRDGVLKLLDMNPRVWGWHTLCARAGVDFPWLLWLMVSGDPVPPTTPRAGVRWLRLSTDAPTAVRELLAGRLPVREYLRSLRWPRESAVFSWDDPAPGLAELPILAWVLGRRLLARSGV